MKHYFLSLLGLTFLSLVSTPLHSTEEFMIKGTSLAVCDQNLQAEINYQPAPLFAPDLKKLPYKCDGPIKTFELTAMEVFTLFHKGFFPGPLYTLINFK